MFTVAFETVAFIFFALVLLAIIIPLPAYLLIILHSLQCEIEEKKIGGGRIIYNQGAGLVYGQSAVYNPGMTIAGNYSTDFNPGMANGIYPNNPGMTPGMPYGHNQPENFNQGTKVEIYPNIGESYNPGMSQQFNQNAPPPSYNEKY